MTAMIRHRVEKSSTNLVERPIERILFAVVIFERRPTLGFKLCSTLPPVRTIPDQDWNIALLDDLNPLQTSVELLYRGA